MNILTDQEKSEKLLPLISKERSRDMSLFLYMGRILVNIFDGDIQALSLWKSVSINEVQSLCDEYWPTISSERIKPRMFMKIGEFLSSIPSVDITNIDQVKKVLYRFSEYSDNAFRMIERLNLEHQNDLDRLLLRKIDIRALERYKLRYDIHTLENWARRDNPKGYEELIMLSNYIDESVYNSTFGSLVWADIQKMIISGDNATSSISNLIKLLRSCIGCVKKGKGFFVMNDIDGISICTETQFISLCSKVKIRRLKNITLDEVILDYMIYLMYRDITYYPGIKDRDTLNLFHEYEAKEISDIDQESIDIILSHVRDILCNGDKDIYEYVLNWLSYVIQSPKKPGTVIMMIGKPGIGKTIFWEWFADSIIGMHNSFIAATLSDITGRFNGHVANKRFILVNECKGTSKHDHEYLKTLITDSYVRLEKKGQDLIQINSSHCIVVTSNYRDHHFIDESDRRFLVLECSREKKDQSYFTKLDDILNRSTNGFYSFLKKRDISEFIPSALPETQIKDDIRDINLHPVQQFLQEYKWSGWLSGSTVYNDYKEWCIQSSIQPVAANRFKIHADHMITTKRVKGCVQYEYNHNQLQNHR